MELLPPKALRIEERYDIVLKVRGQASLPSSVVQVQRADKECGDPANNSKEQ